MNFHFHSIDNVHACEFFFEILHLNNNVFFVLFLAPATDNKSFNNMKIMTCHPNRYYTLTLDFTGPVAIPETIVLLRSTNNWKTNGIILSN